MSKFNRSKFRLIFLCFIASMAAMFQFGYTLAVVNPAQAVLQNFINASHYQNTNEYLNKNSLTWTWSLIVTCYQFGFLIGTIATPFLVEKIGRKWLLIGSGLFDLIGTIPQIIAFPLQIPALLVVGRTLLGISTGLGCGALTLYIQEISPTNIRGLLSSFQAINNNLLTVVGMVFGLPSVLGSPENLPYLMGVAVVPFFLKLLLLPCPDSPKYLLLNKNDLEKARKSILFYHGSDANPDIVIKEIEKEGIIENAGSDANSSWKIVQIFKERHLLKGVLLGSASFLAMNTTGILPLSEYSTELLLDLNTSLNFALLIGVLFAVGFTLTAMLSMLLVERVGRKKLLLVSLICIIGTLLIIMTCAFVAPKTTSDWPGYLAGVSIVVCIGIIGVGPGTIPWYITAELLPQSFRSTGQSLTQIFNILIGFLIAFAFLPIFSAIGGYTFLVLFIIPTVLCVVYLYFQLPETKNREIADIVVDLKKVVKCRFFCENRLRNFLKPIW